MWIAVDPGVTTGVAWSSVHPSQRVEMAKLLGKAGDFSAEVGVAEFASGCQEGASAMEWYQRELTVANRIVDWIVEQSDVEAVVIEDFILRGGTHSAGRGQISPARITSSMFYAIMDGSELGENPFVLAFQQPSEAKGYATNERLKKWGLWTPHKNEHVKDAMRHLVLWGSKNR